MGMRGASTFTKDVGTAKTDPSKNSGEEKSRKPVDYVIVPLNHLIQSVDNALSEAERGKSEASIKKYLQEFTCREASVENFIRELAWPLELRHMCCTHLVVDEHAYNHGELAVLGFFTLMPVVVTIKREAFEGGNDKTNDGNKHWLNYLGDKEKGTVEIPAYEILEIARNFACGEYGVDGRLILKEAERLLSAASDTVGGKLIVLETLKELEEFYRNCGFQTLPESLSMQHRKSNVSGDPQDFIAMVKVL